METQRKLGQKNPEADYRIKEVIIDSKNRKNYGCAFLTKPSTEHMQLFRITALSPGSWNALLPITSLFHKMEKGMRVGLCADDLEESAGVAVECQDTDNPPLVVCNTADLESSFAPPWNAELTAVLTIEPHNHNELHFTGVCFAALGDFKDRILSRFTGEILTVAFPVIRQQ